MKKVLLFSAVVMFAASTLTSCKKQYYCNCTSGTDKGYFNLGKQKKKDAKKACDAWNTIAVLGAGSCSLSTSSEGTLYTGI